MHLYLIVAIALLVFEIPSSFAQTPKGSSAFARTPKGNAALAQAPKGSAQQKTAPTSPQTAQPAQAPAAAAPADNEPSATTASFGDWVLRCQRTGTGSEARRNCELVQSVILKGQQAPVAQFGFGKLAPTEPLHVTAAIPHNISFPSAVRVAIDEKDPQGLELPWIRCLPAACFATAVPKDDLLKRWRAQTGAGRLTFKDARGQDVNLPISFNGLAPGLDALAKEH
jgi:invasion protein IalB